MRESQTCKRENHQKAKSSLFEKQMGTGCPGSNVSIRLPKLRLASPVLPSKLYRWPLREQPIRSSVRFSGWFVFEILNIASIPHGDPNKTASKAARVTAVVIVSATEIYDGMVEAFVAVSKQAGKATKSVITHKSFHSPGRFSIRISGMAKTSVRLLVTV